MNTQYNENWVRQSQGRTFQIEMTDVEVLSRLETALPKRYEPYRLYCLYFEKFGRTYQQRFEETEIETFFRENSKEFRQCFIKSNRLSDFVNLDAVPYPSIFFATNGLINLQRTQGNSPDVPEFSFGIVNRIINESTGEIVVHKEYNSIFNSLRRAFKNL